MRFPDQELFDGRLRRGPPTRNFEAVSVYVEAANKIVALVQRAGSSSMVKALRDSQHLLRSDAVRASDHVVIMWVRDPFDRFASIYYLSRGRALKGVLEGIPNPHWLPVTEMHADYPNIRYHAFETLNETWQDEFPGITLEHINGSASRKAFDELGLDTDTIEKLRVYYANDFALRKELGY